MRDNKAIFVSAFQKPNYKDANRIDHYLAFIAVDAFQGNQVQAFTASCSESDYDLVKCLEFGSSPLDIIYNQTKGYTKVEAVLSIPDKSEG